MRNNWVALLKNITVQAALIHSSDINYAGKSAVQIYRDSLSQIRTNSGFTINEMREAIQKGTGPFKAEVMEALVQLESEEKKKKNK